MDLFVEFFIHVPKRQCWVGFKTPPARSLINQYVRPDHSMRLKSQGVLET